MISETIIGLIVPVYWLASLQEYSTHLGMSQLPARAANLCLSLGLTDFEQGGGIFIVPYQLWHRTSVYTVSSEIPTLRFSVKSPLQQVRGTEDLFYPYSHGITLSSTLSVTRLPFYLANPLPPSLTGQFPEHTRHSDSPRGDWQIDSQSVTAKRNNRKFSWKTKAFSLNLLTIQKLYKIIILLWMENNDLT